MERIIVDTYVKSGKQTWDFDAGNEKTQEFNKKILAVNAMYGWLYNQGVLEKIAFEFKDYSDVTFFAFDAKDLAPYRKSMEQSGVENAGLACEHIFDVAYTPCLYSGAIELGWTMATYRDVDGCVGRSWECNLIQSLGTKGIVAVEDVLEKEGVRAAVKTLFKECAFKPSDLAKDVPLDVLISNAGEKFAEQPEKEGERQDLDRGL